MYDIFPFRLSLTLCLTKYSSDPITGGSLEYRILLLMIQMMTSNSTSSPPAFRARIDPSQMFK
jgi:hypothetical protein